ncbi:hypothetical protein GCM10010521_03030 [Streptomyces rameus]|uniref:Uncharacterized protein n=1 Tax=Streptomyces rameus TaxID=68261 RepID=A0ABP6MP38_9ACTN
MPRAVGAGLGRGLQVEQPCFEALPKEPGRDGNVRVDLGAGVRLLGPYEDG